MEELRSTEILDKEIQEDARKKAENILKNIETDCQKVIEEVSVRVKNTQLEKEKFYATKIDSFEKNIVATLPLEKERFLVSFENKVIKDALEEYFSNLTDEKKAKLLQKLFSNCKYCLNESEINVSYYNIDLDSVKNIIGNEYNPSLVKDYQQLSDIEAENKDMSAGLIVAKTDSSITCRITLKEIIDELLDSNRYELSCALFDGRLPQ